MASFVLRKIRQSYSGLWHDLMSRSKQVQAQVQMQEGEASEDRAPPSTPPPSFWQILTKDNRYLWILLSITLAVASVAALTLALRLLRGSGGKSGSEACGGSSVDYPRISSAPVAPMELTSLQKKIFASSS